MASVFFQLFSGESTVSVVWDFGVLGLWHLGILGFMVMIINFFRWRDLGIFEGLGFKVMRGFKVPDWGVLGYEVQIFFLVILGPNLS